MARPQQPSQEGQKPISERVSDVFEVYLFDISEMASAKRITTADRALYEKARRAFEETRRAAGPDLDPTSAAKLTQVEAALTSARETVFDDAKFVGDGTVATKKEKEVKPTKKERRELRKAREAAGESAPEEATRSGAEAELAPMAPLEQTADQWSAGLDQFEDRLAYFDRWFYTLPNQERAIAVADELVSDIAGLGEDIIVTLDGLGVQLNTIDDVPERLRESVTRYNAALAIAEENQTKARRYDELAVERKRELEKRGKEAEPIAREFITSCAAIEAETAAVLALPHGTPEERYIARARLEALVRGFKLYNDQWEERAKPNLPDGEQWLPVWIEALDAHRSAHRAYAAIKQRRDEFRDVSAQDWLVNSQKFSARLDVLRSRLVKAQTLRSKEREEELVGIKDYYIGVREDWDDLCSQVSRELRQQEDSPVKVLGRVVRGISADVEALLNEKDAKVLRAQEAYGELGRIVVRSFVCWTEGKTFAQRGAFLHKYLDNEVNDSSPEFGEFVRDREVFIQLVAPLAAAKNEIDAQASRRRASAEEREKNQLRRGLRHPWLFNLRADRADLTEDIMEGKFWKRETPLEERRRLIRLGDRLNDDDPALVAAVRSVGRDIPTFRRAVAELEAAKQAITAFEDRLLAEDQEPVVVIDIVQLERLAKEYSGANGDEYEALQAVLALDGWKIADVEERRRAVGEYWRFPNKKTAEKLTDNPDAFREPLNAWRAAVEQKLNRRDAFRWALERNRELIPALAEKKLSKSAQKTVDIVVANANTPAPEPVAPRIRTPEVLDARGEAIREKQREIGRLLAHDMFWDSSVPRATRFTRINAMLRRKRADARLNSDDGLRNVAEFYDAAGFTDFADLEARIARLRAALVPSGDALVAAAAAVPAPVAASAPAPSVVRNAPPAPVSAPAPAAVLSSTAPHPAVAAPAAPSRPTSIAAPVAAVAATSGAAAMLSRLTSRIEARRAGDPVPAPATTGSVPPPLPPLERAAAAAPVAADRAAAPSPEPTAPRAAPASVRAALPVAPALVRRGESAPAGAIARTIEAPVVARTEAPSITERTASEPVRTEAATGGAESAPVIETARRAPEPMRRELPPPPELTNEVRVSSWAKSIRSTVGRWFGRDLGDYVASELTGEQMERERQNQIMGRPEVLARTVSSMIGIAGRVIGFQSLVDVPRYFTQSFIKENERALLRAEILEAMEHEAQGRATGREGDRQRASIEASTRLERAINTSAHLTAEQKAEMVARVNAMRVTYQERSFAVAEARSKELAELVEANVQAKVNGWRAAKETVNSALAVLSFGGAPLIAGIGYGAARGVSYLAMSLQEKYVAAAVQNPRASWVGKVQATFRDTWNSTWNRLSSRTENVGQRLMNAVDALAEIGNAVGVQAGPAISGLERSLPALRSLEGSTDSGIAQIVANAQQAIQATIDRLLPVFERLTARQGSNSVTT